MVVQGKARWAGACTSYLNSNVVWKQLQRVDPTSSVQDHTTLLQKVPMFYFANNFYFTEIKRTFIFHIQADPSIHGFSYPQFTEARKRTGKLKK